MTSYSPLVSKSHRKLSYKSIQDVHGLNPDHDTTDALPSPLDHDLLQNPRTATDWNDPQMWMYELQRHRMQSIDTLMKLKVPIRTGLSSSSSLSSSLSNKNKSPRKRGGSEGEREGEGEQGTNEGGNELPESKKAEIAVRNAVFNLLNSIIGTGIVSLPYVLKLSGLMGGLGLLSLFSYLSWYTLQLLIRSAKLTRTSSYEELCAYCFGRTGFVIISLSLCFLDFGACLSFLIILGDLTTSLVCGFDAHLCAASASSVSATSSIMEGFWNTRRVNIVLFALFIIFPALCYRDVTKIAKLSLISISSVILLITMVVLLYFHMLFTIDRHSYDTLAATYNIGFTDVKSMLPGIGIVAFAFVCHDTSFLVYRTLYSKTMREWDRVCRYSQISAVTICTIFSASAYLMFGGDVKSNILNNFQNSIAITAMRMIYLISMCFSYPMSFYVIRHIVHAVVQIISKTKTYETLESMPFKKLLGGYTIPLFIANVGLALIVSDLGVVMSVSGSIAAMNLAFIMPSAIYLKLTPYSLQFWKEKDIRHQWSAIKHTFPPLLLCLFGISVAIGCSSYTIWQSIVTSNSK